MEKSDVYVFCLKKGVAYFSRYEVVELAKDKVSDRLWEDRVMCGPRISVNVLNV
jgi:hypothetical protein